MTIQDADSEDNVTRNSSTRLQLPAGLVLELPANPTAATMNMVERIRDLFDEEAHVDIIEQMMQAIASTRSRVPGVDAEANLALGHIFKALGFTFDKDFTFEHKLGAIRAVLPLADLDVLIVASEEATLQANECGRCEQDGCVLDVDHDGECEVSTTPTPRKPIAEDLLGDGRTEDCPPPFDFKICKAHDKDGTRCKFPEGHERDCSFEPVDPDEVKDFFAGLSFGDEAEGKSS